MAGRGSAAARSPARGGGDAAAHRVLVEKAASGEVLEVGPIEQPAQAVLALAADVDAFVARAEPAAQELLRRRPQRPSEHGLVFERVFEREETGEGGAIRGDRALPEARVAARDLGLHGRGHLAWNRRQLRPHGLHVASKPRDEDPDQRHDHDAREKEPDERASDGQAHCRVTDLRSSRSLPCRSAGGKNRVLSHQKMK